jgi:hypothetical protein
VDAGLAVELGELCDKADVLKETADFVEDTEGGNDDEDVGVEDVIKLLREDVGLLVDNTIVAVDVFVEDTSTVVVSASPPSANM